MSSPAVLEAMVRILRSAAKPRRIVLFGSHARGTSTPDSDLDVLVIEERVERRSAEMVRLARALSPLRVPVDLLVIDEPSYEKWSVVPGTVYFDARNEGKVLYDSAA